MASKGAERKEPVTRGTGNVFADLGFPDAAERQARLRLAYALNQELEARKISQADAAIDQDVEIVIRRKPRSRKTGRISVVAA